ncbi:MAG: ABC transporter ATP-binding protein [Granulosicoccaceae bacterium]
MNTPVVSVNILSASLRYKGAVEPVYNNLGLGLVTGGWTCLLGPSGCGKSSLLRQLAGLVEPEHNSQLILDRSACATLEGNIAWMGQQDLLFPWLSVLENVCLPQRLSPGRVTHSYREQAISLLKSLGLGGCLAHRPEALSGGMRQRVALARTLIQDKPLVLMDEPFSALDAVSRYELQNMAVELLQDRTVLLVTHDPQEALRLGHRIVRFTNAPVQLQELSCPAMQPPRSLSDLGAAQQDLLVALGVGA